MCWNCISTTPQQLEVQVRESYTKATEKDAHDNAIKIASAYTETKKQNKNKNQTWLPASRNLRTNL